MQTVIGQSKAQLMELFKQFLEDVEDGVAWKVTSTEDPNTLMMQFRVDASPSYGKKMRARAKLGASALLEPSKPNYLMRFWVNAT